MKTHLFVYGTLMLDNVVTALTQKKFARQPARLDGFVRYGVRNQVYPGIVSKPGESTEGVLFSEIDDEAMGIFDWFEGDQYTRITVDVSTNAGTVAAEVYVFCTDHLSELTHEPWDYQRFLKLHAKEYVARVSEIG